MKGRKPRTPEQKAYIVAQKNLNKVAAKFDKAEKNYLAAIENLRTVESTLSLDKLEAVQKLFPAEGKITYVENPTKEAVLEIKGPLTISGNVTFTPGSDSTLSDIPLTITR